MLYLVGNYRCCRTRRYSFRDISEALAAVLYKNKCLVRQVKAIYTTSASTQAFSFHLIALLLLLILQTGRRLKIHREHLMVYKR